MEFKFVGYKADLYSFFSMDNINLNRKLIVVESRENIEPCVKANFNIKGINDDEVITKKEFFDLCFSDNHPVLHGFSRVVALFNSMSNENRKRFKIKTIFDLIPMGKRFFSLYEDISNFRDINPEFLYIWQKEIFTHLESMKNDYKSYISKDNFTDRILYNSSSFKEHIFDKYSSISFVNVVSFTNLEIEVISKLKKLNIYLQMEESEYDKTTLSIKDLSLSIDSKMILVKSSDSFSQNINILKNLKHINEVDFINTKDDYYVLENLTKEIISKNRLLSDTEIFSYFEYILRILENVEFINKELVVKISLLSKIYELKIFEKYYNLKYEDKERLDLYIKQGYKYVSKNMGIFTEFFNDITKLVHIEKFSSFIDFFKNSNFLIDSSDIYLDLEEKIFSVLIEMKSINDNILKGSWRNLFNKKRVSIGLFKVFLDILKKNSFRINTKGSVISKKSINDYSSCDKVYLLNMDESSMNRLFQENFILTSQQRSKMGLPGNDFIWKIQKYKYLRILKNANVSYIYYIQDSSNYESSSFVEEIKLHNNVRTITNKASTSEYKNALLSIFSSNIDNIRLKKTYKESQGIDSLPIAKEDFLKENEFALGFYDYYDLLKCEYRYYLRALIKLQPSLEIKYRIDPHLLGNIVHDVLNFVGEHKSDDLLKGDFDVSEDLVKKILKDLITKERYKISNNYIRYYNEVLFPFIVKGVMSFYNSMKSRLENEKIKKVFLESSEKRIFDKNRSFNVGIKGKVDLRIETDSKKYIIDYKTGHTDSKQLSFYHILYYNSERDVVKWFYKFFDETIKDEYKLEVTMDEIVESMNDFLEQKIYRRNAVRTSCRYCEYLNICKIKGD